MKELLKELIIKSLNKCNINEDVNIMIEIPSNHENGDYSSNIALQLSKKLHDNPKNIAIKIKDNIESEYIDKIDIAGPGFLNFYLKNDYLYENINKVIIENDNYGSSNIGNNVKYNVEYVSANPTGFLHVGHARGASYGDSLTRILKFAGYDVTREYYINDAGNQINNLEKSIIVRYNNFCGLEEELPENGYHGKDIIEVAKTIYDDTLNTLINNGYTYKQDGAIFLKTSLYGDEKDRVLVKSDDNNTYLLPDIAYHVNKYKRGYDKLIDVLGADHHGYINRLKASIQMMDEDPEKLEVKIVQMVRLIKNGEEIKMSKRTGKSLTLNDLIEEVGVDATRYFFAMRSLDTQLDFDLELATKKSNENPVYYVGYAHARIKSILREYKKDVKPIDRYNTLNSEYCLNLLSKIYEFKDTVINSAKRLAPHIITNYVYDLAQAFHTFYAHEKVLTNNEIETVERINLIYATAVTINNACKLIGVNAPDKM